LASSSSPSSHLIDSEKNRLPVSLTFTAVCVIIVNIVKKGKEEMGVLVGFGQILKEVPENLPHSLKSYNLDNGSYAVLLEESVKEGGNGAVLLRVSTLMNAHNAHLQEFVNACLQMRVEFQIRPEWIALPALNRRDSRVF